MALETSQATFTTQPNGGLAIVSPGGTDPVLTPQEVDDLVEYLADADAARTKVANEPIANEQKSLGSLTRAELNDLAASRGIDGAGVLATKQDVIDAIEALPDDAP